MALSSNAVKNLMVATASADVGNEIATAINNGAAAAAQGPVVVAAAIVATSTSQTTDFGALLATDKVIMVPAVAGNADFITPTAGNLGQAAVVGNLYLVLRALSLDAASAVKF